MRRPVEGSEPLYGSIATVRRVGISLRQLYYWVQVLHVVHPQVQQHGMRQFQHFTAEDMKKLRTVKRLLERGYTLRAAAKAVKTP
jgi:DNA-binding transcriptional MerR regulator